MYKDSEDSIIDYLDSLYKVFIEGEYDKVGLPSKPLPGILSLNFGRDQIITCYFPEEEEKIQSIGGKTFSQKQITTGTEDTSEHFKVSPYLLVEPKNLFKAANITLELVKDSFNVSKHIHNEYTFNTTNNFCIGCLIVYDDSNINEYLELVESIYSEMLKIEMSEESRSIVTVNYLQTLKRMNGTLSDSQLGQLIEIKENSKFSDDLSLRTCCNILLNNKLEAEFNFKKMVPVQKFFIVRGPNANLSLAIILLGSFSLLGIIFAGISKRWLSGIVGVLANGMVLVFVYFLLLANGIAG